MSLVSNPPDRFTTELSGRSAGERGTQWRYNDLIMRTSEPATGRLLCPWLLALCTWLWLTARVLLWLWCWLWLWL